MSIEFVDELPGHHKYNGGGAKPDPVLTEFAEALKARPQQWAKWPRTTTLGTARSLATGITRNVPPCPSSLRGGGFEAKSRAGVVYVRFIGETAV